MNYFRLFAVGAMLFGGAFHGSAETGPRRAGAYLGVFDTKEEYLSAVSRYDGNPDDLTVLDFQAYFIKEILRKPCDQIKG